MHLLFLSVFQGRFINPFKNAMNSTVFSKLKKEQNYHAYKKINKRSEIIYHSLL